MVKLFNKQEGIVALDSEDVIATGLDFNIYDLKYDPDLDTNTLPESALRSGTELGAGATKVTVKDTKRTKTGLEVQLEPINLQSVPTADLITHTSYKKDSKLVIRIVKSPIAAADKGNSEGRQEDSDPNFYFDRFSLQSVAESDDERYQLHETFESATLFLFGRRPRIWTYQGIVLNGKRPLVPDYLTGDANKSAREAFLYRYNMDFANELLRRYENHYRGTRTVETNSRAYVLYDDTVVEGTLLNMIAVRNTSIPGAVNVTFSLVVHQRGWVGSSLIDTQEQTLAKILEGKGRGDELENVYAPGVMAPRDTFQQIKQRYDINQETVAANQEEAAKLNQTKSDIESEQDRLEREAVELAGDLQTLNEELAVAEEAGDQEEIDSLKGDIAEVEGLISDRKASNQALNTAKADNQTDLNTATQKLDESEQDQEHLQAQVDQSPENEQSSCPPGYVSGTVSVLHIFIWEQGRLMRATEVSGGIWTDSQGREYTEGISQEDVDVTDYPEYANYDVTRPRPSFRETIKVAGCVEES